MLLKKSVIETPREKQRLRALHSYQVLDTEAEKPYDQLVELASSICQAPIALISLVDERRQWFKAKCGLQASETPREQAFCAHAIQSKEVMEVKDALRDIRFAENPLVLGEPHIRYYAGAPLYTPSGEALGTLCVVDREPRSLEQHQIKALKALADQVVALLELRKKQDSMEVALRHLRDSQDRYRDFLDNATDLIQIVSHDGYYLYVNRSWSATLGYAQEEARSLSFMDIVHPEFRDHCQRSFKTLKRKGKIDGIKVDFMTKDGHRVHVEGNVSVRADGNDVLSTRGIFRNVTEQKQAQVRLKASEERSRKIMQSSRALFCIHDLDGKIIDVNPPAAEALGYKAEDLRGASLLKIMGLTDDKGFQFYLEQLHQHGEHSGIFRVQTKTGERRYWSYKNVLNDQGNVLGFSQDITEQVKVQKALEHSEAKSRALIKAIPDLILLIDADAVVLDYGEARAKAYGLTQNPIGRSIADLWQGRPLARHLKKIMLAMANMEPLSFTSIIKSQNDVGKHFEVRVTPKSKGEAIVIVRDINERKLAEKEILKSQELLREAKRIAGLGVWEYDIPSGLVLWSPEIYEIFGFSDLGKAMDVDTFFEHVHPEDKEMVSEKLRQTIEEEAPYQIAHRVIRADGSVRYVRSSGKAYCNEMGKATRMIGTIQDQTATEEIKLELIKAKDQAEDAARIKQEFLANMSHEIRTPMNGILGFARLLLRNELTPESEQYARLIYESGENLLVIINDILDFSKIEAGKLPIENVHFDINRLFNSIQQLFESRAESKQLGFSTKLGSSIPGVLIGDPVRLFQILNNLLGNALKFTEQGSVRLDARYNALDEENGELSLVVNDTGIGVSEDRQEAIFRSFEQEKGSITRRFGGTGLGLSIVKKLVELMNGRLSLRSQLGKGSEFTVVLPLKTGSADLVEVKAAEQHHRLDMGRLKGLKVLMAEDNKTNQLLGERFLTSAGCDVQIVDNGLEALAKVQEEHFDVVLMDIQMPEMDGMQATRSIRALPKACSKVPIIALTAHALKEEEDVYRQIGMDEYVSKPFRPDTLYRKLIGVMEA